MLVVLEDTAGNKFAVNPATVYVRKNGAAASTILIIGTSILFNVAGTVDDVVALLNA